jgi:hypothetical protein
MWSFNEIAEQRYFKSRGNVWAKTKGVKKDFSTFIKFIEKL